jgi:hypothetical protein
MIKVKTINANATVMIPHLHSHRVTSWVILFGSLRSVKMPVIYLIGALLTISLIVTMFADSGYRIEYFVTSFIVLILFTAAAILLVLALVSASDGKLSECKSYNPASAYAVGYITGRIVK